MVYVHIVVLAVYIITHCVLSYVLRKYNKFWSQQSHLIRQSVFLDEI